MSKKNRNHKDTVFVDLFSQDISSKANFISLYNALNGTNLDPETTELQNVRLENIIYRSFYNDVSFIVDDHVVVLIEQQSTINENMPLRFLEYVARIYEKITSNDIRFARRLQKIPTPEFYVLYNGVEDYPSEKVLRLSDAYCKKNVQSLKLAHHQNSENFTQNDFPPLELIVKVVNINTDKGALLLKKCEPLKEYSIFVETVRRHLLENRVTGYDSAIKECLKNQVMKDYLRRKTKEILNMLVGEYDYETDIAVQREEAFNEGEYQKSIEIARTAKSLNLPINEIVKLTGLSKEEIEKF